MKSKTRKTFFQLATIIISLLIIAMLTGCSDNDDEDLVLRYGTFVDSPVEGLIYKTFSSNGVTNTDKTDANGRFCYYHGEQIAFYVGDIQLGEKVTPKATITPLDLVPGAKSYNDQHVLLIARFLQTLDKDNDQQKISIVPEIHTSATKSDSFDPSEIVFVPQSSDNPLPFIACEQSVYTAFYQVKAAIPITKTTLVSESAALIHLSMSLSNESNSTNSKITVSRDEMGVWFLKGPDDASLYDIFYEVGYQVATDRLWQLETYQRASRGRLADILGDADSIETDKKVRIMGYSDDELKEGFDNLDADSKEIINGYVAGINNRIDYVLDHRSNMPMEFVAIGTGLMKDLLPTKWTVKDVLAWSALLQRQFDPEALERGQIENAELANALTSQYTTTTPYGAVGELMLNDLRWQDSNAETYITGNDAIKFAPRKRNIMLTSIPKIPNYSNTLSELKKIDAATRRTYNKLNINIDMGCYAWVIHGDKTTSGNPILYAGPQMNFEAPPMIIECSIDAGGLKVSGMMVPGIPGVIMGRTPHHAWSLQVGHAHTTDYYFDVSTQKVELDRTENISVGAGSSMLTIYVYKYKLNENGVDKFLPVVSPNFDKNTYSYPNDSFIASWRYSHFNHEFDLVKALLTFAQANNYTAFGKGIEDLGMSQHICYADTEGNIAYWMSGRDPIRPDNSPTGYLLPQMPGSHKDWLNTDDNLQRAHAVNPEQGYFAGWNNLSHPEYSGAPNNIEYSPGPFHRSHVIYEYLDMKTTNGNKISYEEVKDLARHIAQTDSFGEGGVPWKYVASACATAITQANIPSNYGYTQTDRLSALSIINDWYANDKGYFVAGIESSYTNRLKGWKLMDTWMRKLVDITFQPYPAIASQPDQRLFNVIVRSFQKKCLFNWFAGTVAPYQPHETTAYETIVNALDEAINELGGTAFLNGNNVANDRGRIKVDNSVVTNIKLMTIEGVLEKIAEALTVTSLVHEITSTLQDGLDENELSIINLLPDIIPEKSLALALSNNSLWEIPYASRAIYEQCIEYGSNGPTKIESVFPLGQSGHIYWNLLLVGASDPHFKHFLAPHFTKIYHEHFFDMSLKYYDQFKLREFPLFEQ